MNTIDTATRLLQGSRNIDKMKREIPEVIAIVMGFIRSYCCECAGGKISGFDSHFESEDCSWRVMFDTSVSDTHQLVECYTNKSFGKAMIFATNHQVPFKTGDVLRVYEGLEVLLDGLAKQFPKLESVWKPLIDASEIDLSK